MPPKARGKAKGKAKGKGKGTPQRRTVVYGGRATDVQSVTFDKQYWDVRRAKSWLRERGFKSPKVDETANQLRFRQRAPGQYNQYATKKLDKNINLVLGIRKDAPKRAAKGKGKPKGKAVTRGKARGKATGRPKGKARGRK